MPAITAYLGLLPDDDRLRPRVYIGSTVTAQAQFRDAARQPAAPAGPVTFLWKGPSNVVIERAGTAVPGKVGRYESRYEPPVPGDWATRARDGGDGATVDWVLFQVVDEPPIGPEPNQAIWMTSPDTALVSMRGTHLAGITICDLPALAASDFAAAELPVHVVGVGARKTTPGAIQAEAVSAATLAGAEAGAEAGAGAGSIAGAEAGAASAQPFAADAALDAQRAAAAADETAATVANAAVQRPTLAALQGVTGAEGQLGVVYGTGTDRGQYRFLAGVWVRESDTLPQVQAQVTGVTTRFISDDEAPDDIILRDEAGNVLMSWDSQGLADFLPSPSFATRIVNAEALSEALSDDGLSVPSVTLPEPPADEAPIKPVVSSANGLILIGHDALGRIDFQHTPSTGVRIRASALDAIQVCERLPKESDGLAAAYAVGAEWVTPAGQVHVLTDAGEIARWRQPRVFYPRAGNGFRDGRLPLPGDAIAGKTPRLVAGLVRMRAGYNGPAALITRDSDGATLTLWFTPSGAVDWPALRAFIAGTVGRVDRLYFQDGSGGYLSWGGTERPMISPAPQVGRSPGVVFDVDRALTREMGLVIPSSVTANANSVSVFMAATWRHSLREMMAVELSGASPIAFGKRRQGGNDGLSVWAGGFNTILGGQPHLGAMFAGFSSGADALRVYMHDRAVRVASPLASSPLAGGNLGLGTVGFTGGSTRWPGGYILGGICIYDQALTPEEVALLRQSMSCHFDMRPQVRGLAVFSGDSIVEGPQVDQLTYMESVPRRVARLLRRPMQVCNYGLAGARVEPIASAYAERAAVSLLRNPAQPEVYCISAGTNNISEGDDAATIYGQIKAYAQAVKADGWRVIISNIRPKLHNAGAEAVRLQVNQALRDGWASDIGADRFLDYAAVPIIGADAAGSDPTLYYDGTHQTDYARAIEAPAWADLIDDLVGVG